MARPAGPPQPPLPAGSPPPAAGPVTCARHPDRPTGLRCTRCDRPACPDCLREASVGHQCVDCVGAGNRGARRRPLSARNAWVRSAPGTRPVAVTALIALNVVVYALTVVQAGSATANDRAPLFDAWSLVPALVADGEWWRIVTSGFLHFGPLHLLFNMWALWVIGKDVELVLGRARFVSVYVVSLLGGSAAVMVFNPDVPTAGASAAVFGLMGGLAVLVRRMRVPAGQVFGLIAVNLFLSFVIPNISIAGHLGGLAVGAAATAAIVYAPARNRTLVQAGGLVGLAVLVLAVIGVTAAALS